ncbi:phosphatase 2C-like domain-containing protein [Daedaleopsis nitida]|nr:phosphatase 2C-like domain-containing protein [Daedaleopsis nitida]
MKTIHKRLYTVLPRPPVASSSSASSSHVPIPRLRSNSASSPRFLYTAPPIFFDGSQPPPPPPSTRGHTNVMVSSARLVAEVRGEIEGHTTNPSSQQQSGHPSYSLALTLGQSESSSHLPLLPYSPFLPYPSLAPLFVYSAKSQDAPAPDHRKKRQRMRYHLDVGAYGIPKRSRGPVVAGRDGHGRFDVRSEPDHEELGRAVQVGEDAYFVRDNAMGVADGVGGWSRLRRTANSAEPSASALFARRLMHYCSEEVDAASEQAEQPLVDADLYSEADDDIYAELEDSLEELEEGLDVLMILEKAYEKALRSHVCPADQSSSSGSSRSLPPSDNNSEPVPASPSAHVASSSSAPEPSPAFVPLFEGSSTALVAILEHRSTRSQKPLGDPALFNPQPRPNTAAQPEVSTDGAVIRIAHLGDCMAMLVRGEEIVWRTEEMWWNFNTPVQLGPTSSTKPHDARIFTIPVQEDDILILASDGLSDNLWDTDILDEVVRFRRSFMGPLVSEDSQRQESTSTTSTASTTFRRSTLAGMLSEALCSRAKRVSETRGPRKKNVSGNGTSTGAVDTHGAQVQAQVEHDVPFARRAREQGKSFEGGKPDDISVLVAVISPVE